MTKLLVYIVQRLLLAILVMVGVLLITFVAARLLPTDPIHLILPERELTRENIDRVTRELGLDRPVYEQFVLYLGNVLRGDLGHAYHTGNPVISDIKRIFPATFELTTISLIVTVILAIPLGVWAAIRRDGLGDHIARITSLFGVAMPGFWFGLLLIFFLYYHLGISPAPMGRLPIGISVERVTGIYTIDALLAHDMVAFWATVKQLTLPVLALSIRSVAILVRLTRSSMIEVLNADFIRVARAQGLRSRLIHYRLGLKNALLSPVTMIGHQYGTLLSGVAVIEVVFAWPGLGRWSVNAALSGDYAPVQAFAMLAAGLRVIIFLLVDMIYFLLDPRIRY